MVDERLGKAHFWLTFIGFHTTFLVQHWLGSTPQAACVWAPSTRRWIEYVYDSGVPGLPQLKAYGWLVLRGTRPEDEYPRYLMLARLEHQMDAPHGWTLELHACERPGRKVKRWYASEEEARAATNAIYQLGDAIGTWRWHTYPGETPSAAPRSSPGLPRTRARSR
jgi:hypothetical protein